MSSFDSDPKALHAWSPTRADLAGHFTRTDIDRGEALARSGAVRDLRPLPDGSPGRRALVQGTQPRPYTVTLAVTRARKGGYGGKGGMGLMPMCTCPVGYACKHGAAAMLRWIDDTSAAPGQPGVNPAVELWTERLHALRSDAAPPKPAKAPKEALFYTLDATVPGAASLSIDKARVGDDGLPHGRTGWTNIEQALRRRFAYMSEADAQAVRLLWLYANAEREHWEQRWTLPSHGGDEILRALARTGRLGLARPDGVVHLATLIEAPRAARLAWRVGADGRQRPSLAAADDGQPLPHILLLDSVWFADPMRAEFGPLALQDVDLPTLRLLFELPALGEADTLLVAQALAEHLPTVPRPAAPREAPRLAVRLEPVLRLDTLTRRNALLAVRAHRGYAAQQSYDDPRISIARVHWRYVAEQARDASGEALACSFTAQTPQRVHKGGPGWGWPAPPGPHLMAGADGALLRIERDADAERARMQELTEASLWPLPAGAVLTTGAALTRLWGLDEEDAWPLFFSQVAPALRERGWQVVVEPGFAHRVHRVEAWHAEVAEDEAAGAGRFLVSLGIDVAGQRLDLAPLLAELLRRDPRWSDRAHLNSVADDAVVHLMAPDGARIDAPASRIKPLLAHLIDLFDQPQAGSLSLSRWDAVRLTEALDRWQFKGADALHALAERLRAAGGVGRVEPPKGLGLALRPYQREGLAWLQYLREHALSGILADDMGLGKTAQTLAHVLLEKQDGRLDRPALVVLPTSLVFNWQAEAAQVAPALSVLALHGPERAERFRRIPEHDLVLTTYPLLWRDADALVKHEYHLLILDEAQQVKNAASRGAETVRRFNARHRLCLTGTPLENHLGELWTQFDFLMPGFLGDSRQFARQWRTPVERHGAALRAELLARRVRPFILRRRKDQVAKELPPKSVIVRRVALVGAQRELYESVRIAVDEELKREIAARGFARSQIAVLDALLKLRQVCCDPHLVKRVKLPKGCERAKLALLESMLPELIAEGRRVLLFSQFTEMLELIENALPKLGIEWIKLTGQTRDRASLVKRFQAGAVPLFLISLKAGGVGLNLTAADTVIHFDPWWNPAAEDQATDRAHRIGQDKPVFVYKLVAEGSIEERILALQDKKALLAAGVLGADAAGAVKFGQADIEALLAPMEPLE
jgi:superfamily II DNA or RNA helicase